MLKDTLIVFMSSVLCWLCLINYRNNLYFDCYWFDAYYTDWYSLFSLQKSLSCSGVFKKGENDVMPPWWHTTNICGFFAFPNFRKVGMFAALIERPTAINVSVSSAPLPSLSLYPACCSSHLHCGLALPSPHLLPNSKYTPLAVGFLFCFLCR